MLVETISICYIIAALVFCSFSFLIFYFNINNKNPKDVNYFKHIAMILGCVFFTLFSYFEVSPNDGGISFFANLFASIFNITSFVLNIYYVKKNKIVNDKKDEKTAENKNKI